MYQYLLGNVPDNARAVGTGRNGLHFVIGNAKANYCPSVFFDGGQKLGFGTGIEEIDSPGTYLSVFAARHQGLPQKCNGSHALHMSTLNEIRSCVSDWQCTSLDFFSTFLTCIEYISFPDWGVWLLRQPSDHPERILLPSLAKRMQLVCAWGGPGICKTCWSISDQIRMPSSPQLPNTLSTPL